MYDWSRHPTSGAPPWLRPLTDSLTDSPYGVTALTWGSIALEFTLALAILVGPQAKRLLLVAGPLFHAGIAVHMGPVSFLAAMSAALLLALLPPGHNIRWPSAGPRWETQVS